MGSVAAVADCLAALVDARGWEAPPHHWDFVTITLCSLVASLERSKHAWSCAKVALLGGAVLRLLDAVARFVVGAPAECQRRLPAAHVAALPTEWADVFAPDLTTNVFALIVHVLGECPPLRRPPSSARRRLPPLCRRLQRRAQHLRWPRGDGARPARRRAPAALGAPALGAARGPLRAGPPVRRRRGRVVSPRPPRLQVPSL